MIKFSVSKSITLHTLRLKKRKNGLLRLFFFTWFPFLLTLTSKSRFLKRFWTFTFPIDSCWLFLVTLYALSSRPFTVPRVLQTKFYMPQNRSSKQIYDTFFLFEFFFSGRPDNKLFLYVLFSQRISLLLSPSFSTLSPHGLLDIVPLLLGTFFLPCIANAPPKKK